MIRHKIGFHKTVQGSFTQERIEEIKRRLIDDHNCEIIEADFREGVLIDGKVYVGDICLNEVDVYFWHDTIWPSRTGSDSYYLHLLRAIETTAKVINTADGTEAANDKLRAHSLLKSAGLPVSKYALIRSDDRHGIDKAFQELGGRALIKPRFGGWGTGIVKCESLEDLYGVVELSASMSGRHQQFLLEQFYDNDPAGWVSVSMVGQQPLLAYRKPLSLGGSDWKVYDPDKQDGKGVMSEYVSPSEELISLSQRAQQAIGKDIIGFDFIKTAEGYKIVDENGRPGLYEHCLQQAGVDIVDVTVELIMGKIEK